MELHIEPVTDDNREEAILLSVAEGQEGFVESVSVCLEEAERRRCWRPVVLYDGDQMIGFAMYGFFIEYLPFGRLWLDRFLIDRKYQGKGYGKAALAVLLERLDREYHRRKIYLSVVRENPVAAAMYEQFGFSFTGELDIHGEQVMVCRRR